MTKFQNAVIRAVSSIPCGTLASYGQIAAYLGMPRAARQVGWTLRSLEGVDIPWWRVINNQGRISIKGNRFQDRDSQARLLKKENIMVDKNYDIDIEKYRWKPDITTLKYFDLINFE